MEVVNFQSSGSTVQGYYFPAKGKESLGTVVFLQGFPGVEGDELICAKLAERGLNVLTFNYRGVFNSEGYFSFSHAVEDIRAAVQFITELIRIKKNQSGSEKNLSGRLEFWQRPGAGWGCQECGSLESLHPLRQEFRG